MKFGRSLLGFVAVVAISQACTFPTPSKDYACDTTEDCDPDRVCSPAKFCVIPNLEEPDAGVGSDAAPVDSMMPIDGDPFAAIRQQCIAAGYTQEATTGNYYRIVTTADDWNAAYADCNNDVVGATHLITLSNQVEIDFQKTRNEYWVGWIDRPVENTWHLLTDEVPTVIAPWGSGGRPDGGNSENCAIWRNNLNGLDDVDCPQNHDYVCECDGRPVTKPPM